MCIYITVTVTDLKTIQRRSFSSATYNLYCSWLRLGEAIQIGCFLAHSSTWTSSLQGFCGSVISCKFGPCSRQTRVITRTACVGRLQYDGYILYTLPPKLIQMGKEVLRAGNLNTGLSHHWVTGIDQLPSTDIAGSSCYIVGIYDSLPPKEHRCRGNNDAYSGVFRCIVCVTGSQDAETDSYSHQIM